MFFSLWDVWKQSNASFHSAACVASQGRVTCCPLLHTQLSQMTYDWLVLLWLTGERDYAPHPQKAWATFRRPRLVWFGKAILLLNSGTCLWNEKHIQRHGKFHVLKQTDRKREKQLWSVRQWENEWKERERNGYRWRERDKDGEREMWRQRYRKNLERQKKKEGVVNV